MSHYSWLKALGVVLKVILFVLISNFCSRSESADDILLEKIVRGKNRLIFLQSVAAKVFLEFSNFFVNIFGIVYSNADADADADVVAAAADEERDD